MIALATDGYYWPRSVIYIYVSTGGAPGGVPEAPISTIVSPDLQTENIEPTVCADDLEPSVISDAVNLKPTLVSGSLRPSMTVEDEPCDC